MKLTVRSPLTISCYVVLIRLVSYLKLINLWPGLHFTMKNGDFKRIKYSMLMLFFLFSFSFYIYIYFFSFLFRGEIKNYIKYS